jgi:hypothetical protein
MEKLLNGADGLVARAPKGTIQEKAYNYLAAKVKVGARLAVLVCQLLVDHGGSCSFRNAWRGNLIRQPAAEQPF